MIVLIIFVKEDCNGADEKKQGKKDLTSYTVQWNGLYPGSGLFLVEKLRVSWYI